MSDEKDQDKINEDAYMHQFEPTKPKLPVDEDEGLDIGLGTDYSKPTTVGDSPEYKQNQNYKKGFLIALAVGAIVVSLIWINYTGTMTIFEEKEPYSQSQCEGILQEGKAIVMRNGGNDNYYEWNNEEDKQKVMVLEDEFIQNCVVDKQQILHDNYKRCAEILVDWHVFVDELPSKDKKSWDEKTRETDIMFANEFENFYCGMIQDDLLDSSQMELHNNEYHGGEDTE